MSELEELKSELLALRSFAIAAYSVSADRSLIDEMAKHIHSKLAAQSQIDPQILSNSLKQMKEEFNAFGYPS